MPDKARIAVLISGRGSNMVALLDSQPLCANARFVGVISNDPHAAGLELAGTRGIHTQCVNHKAFATREAFDAALGQTLTTLAPELVILAGFMRILTPAFTAQWHGRMLNIHPSLLPAYPGLHTHARVLADGVSEHGATVHFVTGELDGGPAVLQARVPVLPHDTEAALASRVLAREHHILPLAALWFATGRLRLPGTTPELDGTPLDAPLQYPHDVPDAL